MKTCLLFIILTLYIFTTNTWASNNNDSSYTRLFQTQSQQTGEITDAFGMTTITPTLQEMTLEKDDLIYTRILNQYLQWHLLYSLTEDGNILIKSPSKPLCIKAMMNFTPEEKIKLETQRLENIRKLISNNSK